MKKLLSLILLMPTLVWAQSAPIGAFAGFGNSASGGGSGAASIISGTTIVTGGTNKDVCFNDSGVINCGDNGLQYTKSTGTLVPTIIAPTTPVAVANGGSGAATFTAHGVLLGEATSAFGVTTAGSSGQPLISGGASADPAYGTLGVAGGGTGATTITGLVLGNGASAMSAYGGSGSSSGNVIASLDASGVPTFVPAGSTNITNVTGSVYLVANKSTTGTTVNKLAKIDTTASPATAVILTTSDTVNVLGVVVSGAGTTGNATILAAGESPCVFDNGTTVGDYVVASTTTAGDCHDTGSATVFPTAVAVLGTVATTNASAGTYQVFFNTPDVASASGGPSGKGTAIQTNGTSTKSIANFNDTTPVASGNNTLVTWQQSTSANTTSVSAQIDPTGFKNLAYNGTLTIKDQRSNTSSTTVAHRIEICGSGAGGNVAMTMPSTSAVGDVYSLVQRNTSHTCNFTANSGATLNGASTLTIAAGVVASGNHEDCVCLAITSGACTDWECGGPGT